MEGLAAIYYQSISTELPTATWDSFCRLLHDRFDRDQHEYLLRQMFNIRQQTTVFAYVTAFSELVD
jgi:Trp operon repressor